MPSWEKYGKDRHRLPGKWVQATIVEEVWGVRHRKANVRAFCDAVKKAAVKSGRDAQASGGKGQAVLHKSDGKIREERTYGADPRKTPG